MIDFNDVQPSNAYSSILVTLFGISIFVKLVQLSKVLSYITFTLFGITLASLYGFGLYKNEKDRIQ